MKTQCHSFFSRVFGLGFMEENGTGPFLPKKYQGDLFLCVCANEGERIFPNKEKHWRRQSLTTSFLIRDPTAQNYFDQKGY